MDDRIQVIFLFTSYRQLKLGQQVQVLEVVQSAAQEILYFGVKNQVQVTLEDGRSRTEPSDLVLAIEKQNNPPNDARRRTDFSNKVAEKLKEIDGMKALGYRGQVTWQDGLVPAPKTSSARSNKLEEEAAEKPAESEKAAEDPLDYHTRAKKYQAEEALYPFEMLQVTDATLSKINVGLDRIKIRAEGFQRVGLVCDSEKSGNSIGFLWPVGHRQIPCRGSGSQQTGQKDHSCQLRGY